MNFIKIIILSLKFYSQIQGSTRLETHNTDICGSFMKINLKAWLAKLNTTFLDYKY